MAIEISEFADVSISVSPVGVAGGNFGILGFLTNELDGGMGSGGIGPAERARAYTSLASVGDDWLTSTEVYKAAAAFYGQTPTPRDFVVQVCYEVAQPASLTGGIHEDPDHLVSTFTGLGELDITIDGTPVSLTDIDFSGATSLAEIATLLTNDLNAVVTGATVTYSKYGFEIRGNTTGSSGAITFGTGDVAIAMGFIQALGKISLGLDIETPVQALAAAASQGIVTVGLVTHKKYRDKTVEPAGQNTADIAAWAEGSKRIFCNTTNYIGVLSSVVESDVATILKNLSFRFTLTTYSRDEALYPSASVFGRAASVNFESIGSTITLNLKQMPGVVAEDLTPGEFAVLRSKFASAVVRIGKTVNAYTDSRMASGSWLDTTHGLMWLENRCETDMFNLMYGSNTKVPYTQEGINRVAAVLNRSLNAAVRNGLAAPGYLPDGRFLPEGYVVYVIPLADVAPSDKGNRLYRGLSFEMTGAGAFHEIVVSGSFSE